MTDTHTAKGATYPVFVYGTLKNGQSNHSYYLGGSEFVGGGTTKTPFAMYNNGGYPVCFQQPDKAKPVKGEIYEVNDAQLKKLDALEGHPKFFRREEIEVELAEGVYHTAWMYFGVPESWNRSLASGLPLAKETSGIYDWSR